MDGLDLDSFCDEVLIATESGRSGFQGNVLEMMEARGITADYYLSCGPKPMLKALAGYCSRQKKPLQVSLEERMGCGYGACVGCTCRIKEKSAIVKQKKVCKDGPVFFGNEVIDLFWLKDDDLEASENLPAPDILAREIVEDLEAALLAFTSVETALGNESE